MKIQISILMGAERHFWCCPDLTMGLASWLIASNEHEVRYCPVTGHAQSQSARNAVIQSALESECDYLVMIDNDTIPVTPHGGIVDLFAMCELGLDIVAAPAPVVKGDDLFLNGYMRHPPAYRNITLDEFEAVDERGLIKVDAVGFGFICLSWDVMEKMERLTRTCSFDSNGDVTDSFCEPGVPVHRLRSLDGQTQLGEDLLFCLRAQRYYEIQPYMVPSQLCGHLHTIDYGKIPTVKRQKSAKEYGITKSPLPIDNYTMAVETLDWLYDVITTPRHGTMQYVLELGSGFSTTVIASALRQAHRNNYSLISLDEDLDSVTRVNASLEDNGLPLCSMYARLLDGFYSREVYWGSLQGRCFDLIVIDGPSSLSKGDRPEGVKRFSSQLRQGGLLLFDDYQREDNAKCVEEIITNGAYKLEGHVGRAVILRKL